MKAKHKSKLQENLIIYAKQIGILDDEIPRLIFNKQEMKQRVAKHGHDSVLYIDKNTMGRANYSTRTIFINERGMNGYRKVLSTNGKKYVTRLKDGDTYTKFKYRKWDHREQLHTLIHELVHYRFHTLPHGPRFDARIRDILRGKTFPPEHVHLFYKLPKELEVN